MEQIAMDMGALLAFQFPDVADRADDLRNAGLVTRMRAGGKVLYERYGLDVSESAAAWTSDTARGWAAMAVGLVPNLEFDQRLALTRPFADDTHFAVREWAWLSLRPHVADDVFGAIHALAQWTSEESERLRRFTTEVTRPRGVWSVHLPVLKSTPELGLPLLEPLRSDTSRYVQDSVANWLNDASKSQPLWVRQLCERWAASEEGSTKRICRRALRSIGQVVAANADL
jgi:3-methyladenine DNA glycosylase AlkC